MPDISVEVAALSISSPQYSSDLACIDMDSNAETILEHCFMARTKQTTFTSLSLMDHFEKNRMIAFSKLASVSNKHKPPMVLSCVCRYYLPWNPVTNDWTQYCPHCRNVPVRPPTCTWCHIPVINAVSNDEGNGVFHCPRCIDDFRTSEQNAARLRRGKRYRSPTNFYRP